MAEGLEAILNWRVLQVRSAVCCKFFVLTHVLLAIC